MVSDQSVCLIGSTHFRSIEIYSCLSISGGGWCLKESTRSMWLFLSAPQLFGDIGIHEFTARTRASNELRCY